MFYLIRQRSEVNLVAVTQPGNSEMFYIFDVYDTHLLYIKDRNWEWIESVGAQGQGVEEVGALTILVSFGATLSSLYKQVDDYKKEEDRLLSSPWWKD